MPTYFTQYWSLAKIDLTSQGQILDHTAADTFSRAGIKKGDHLYILTLQNGAPVLIGRMIASDNPISRSEASKRLKYKPWNATEHLMAQKGSSSTIDYERSIPWEIAKKLRFISAPGRTSLKFITPRKLDQQTLRSIRKLTPESADLLETLLDSPEAQHIKFESSNETPIIPSRTEVLINKLNRNSTIVRRLKGLYKDTCQICLAVIDLPEGRRYSEGHHVRPLGSEHEGSDTLDNLLCVCPNCHIKLDYGCIKLQENNLHFKGTHRIKSENIDYHNHKIFGRIRLGQNS